MGGQVVPQNPKCHRPGSHTGAPGQDVGGQRRELLLLAVCAAGLLQMAQVGGWVQGRGQRRPVHGQGPAGGGAAVGWQVYEGGGCQSSTGPTLRCLPSSHIGHVINLIHHGNPETK